MNGRTDGQIYSYVTDLLCFLQRQTEVASYDVKCYGTTKMFSWNRILSFHSIYISYFNFWRFALKLVIRVSAHECFAFIRVAQDHCQKFTTKHEQNRLFCTE
jgi:hypothetical protein